MIIKGLLNCSPFLIGTIPNEVTIPSNVVAMFESDFTALNDNIPGLSY